MKPTFSSGAHQGAKPFWMSSAMATMSSALSASADANCAPMTMPKPRGRQGERLGASALEAGGTGAALWPYAVNRA